MTVSGYLRRREYLALGVSRGISCLRLHCLKGANFVCETTKQTWIIHYVLSFCTKTENCGLEVCFEIVFVWFLVN